MKTADLDTPSLVVDLDIMEDNMKRMHKHLKQNGIPYRPHVKTHKVPALARRQMEAGSVGVTCQKVGEAEVMVEGGLEEIFLSYNIVGRQKLERLTSLVRRANLILAADSEYVLEGLSSVAQVAGKPIGILIECDIAGVRSGVRSPAGVLQLAETIDRDSSLHLEGLFSFKGGYFDKEHAGRVNEFFEESLERMSRAGLEARTVSAEGTVYAWHAWPEFASKVINESRPGLYIFNDTTKVDQGIATLEQCALRLVCTVLSHPGLDEVIIDGGSKTFGYDGYFLDSYGHVLEYPEAQLQSFFEEHGVITTRFSREKPALGERVTIIPNCGTAVINLHDTLYGIRGEEVEEIWPIEGRGKVQ